MHKGRPQVERKGGLTYSLKFCMRQRWGKGSNVAIVLADVLNGRPRPLYSSLKCWLTREALIPSDASIFCSLCLVYITIFQVKLFSVWQFVFDIDSPNLFGPFFKY